MSGVELSSISQQDPHSIKENRENNLETAIGKQVRECRHHQSMTVSELAKLTGLSTGMLSKIENGNTSPSLTTLQSLAHALSVPLTAFFKKYEERRACVHTKSGHGLEVEGQGTRAGHQYNLLGHIGANDSGVIVEPYLITLSSEADSFKTFQHSGIETIYMLKGAVDYRHGDHIYSLRRGDTLFLTPTHHTAPTNWSNCPPCTCPLSATHRVNRSLNQLRVKGACSVH